MSTLVVAGMAVAIRIWDFQLVLETSSSRLPYMKSVKRTMLIPAFSVLGTCTRE
jgi:hypothetical protein